MSSDTGHDLSSIVYTGNGDHSNSVIAIVVSKWNTEITGSLCAAAIETLTQAGVGMHNVQISYVPGTFELPFGAQQAIRHSRQEPDAVICIGCVIQGETRHFDFICSTTANCIASLGLEYDLPVIFGVLTPNTLQQAQDRAGGRLGNKGQEAAVAALDLIDLQRSYPSDEEPDGELFSG
jgi:6,7-dimethyl-8-ribityllumazine synthase